MDVKLKEERGDGARLELREVSEDIVDGVVEFAGDAEGDDRDVALKGGGWREAGGRRAAAGGRWRAAGSRWQMAGGRRGGGRRGSCGRRFRLGRRDRIE